MKAPSIQLKSRSEISFCWLTMAIVVLVHLLVKAPNEPVFNGDENRHVMTSVFFCDLLTDRPLDHLREYTEDYYDQYPALGLLVWPPLFHGVVGGLMTLFGTSVLVPRLFVFATWVLAAFSLFRICRRRMEVNRAWCVTAVFSLMPMIFEFSRHAMLEMPTLALCLVCLDQFDLWDRDRCRRRIYFAATAAAFAALTRFDAIVLLPILLLQTALGGKWRRLLNRDVLIAAVFAIALVSPTYFVILNELGDLHLRQAVESVSGRERPMFALGSLAFYPSKIPEQVGWGATSFFLVGFAFGFRRVNRSEVGMFAAILIGTYVTFTPLAELSSRHAIYWLPGIAWLAVVGAECIAAAMHRLARSTVAVRSAVPIAILVSTTAAASWNSHVYSVTGYRRAAEVALTNSSHGETIFIDGWWDGNMTYQLRHLDPSRSRKVVRADKLLYDFTNVPNVDFEQFVDSDLEILGAIASVAPQCVIFEDPQPFGDIEISRRMRTLIRSKSDLFPLLKAIDVDSTVPGARTFSIYVFGVDRDLLMNTLIQKAP